MADITFDVWLKRNKKPGEAMREAISRYSDEQFVGRRGRDYLTEVFSDEIEAEDQVKLAEQPEPPPAPDEQPYADFGDTMYKSLVGLGQTGAGLAATVLPEGYGRETMTDIAQDLQEVKVLKSLRLPTRIMFVRVVLLVGYMRCYPKPHRPSVRWERESWSLSFQRSQV